jgi:hypothetical protein
MIGNLHIYDRTMILLIPYLLLPNRILVKVPSSHSQRAAQCVSVLRIVGVLLMAGCQVIIRKACTWTIVGNMFGECHAPSTLKTSFVDFEKE